VFTTSAIYALGVCYYLLLTESQDCLPASQPSAREMIFDFGFLILDDSFKI
jgi:hypothetical protein